MLHIDPVAGTVGFNSQVDFLIDFNDDTRVFGWNVQGDYLLYEAEMLIPGAASGYHYTSYGGWSETIFNCLLFTCATEFFADTFYFGSPTGTGQMPSVGKVTFNGTMQGYYVPATQRAYELNGTTTLVADFEARTITGSFHDIVPYMPFGWGGTPPASFGDISVSAEISGSAFSGSVSGGGGSGSLRGDFFGPNAAEMGGVFRTPTTIGAFAAKR